MEVVGTTAGVRTQREQLLLSLNQVFAISLCAPINVPPSGCCHQTSSWAEQAVPSFGDKHSQRQEWLHFPTVPAAPQCVTGKAELTLPHSLPVHRLLCCFSKIFHQKKVWQLSLRSEVQQRPQPLKSRCSSHPCLKQQQNFFHTEAMESKPSAENSFFQNYGGAQPCSLRYFLDLPAPCT